MGAALSSSHFLLKIDQKYADVYVEENMNVETCVSTIQTLGYYLWESMISQDKAILLLEGIEHANLDLHARKKDGKVYALRNILNCIPIVRETAIGETIFPVVRAILGQHARPVKATLFDKTAEANWNLRWHQDNVIAVSEKKELAGFHGWTEKVGIPHVRPPVKILEQMLAARIHLDDCPEDNGALVVIPSTHSSGRLSDDLQKEKIQNNKHVVLPAKIGDVLFMRPLLLHSSKPSKQASHRRVLHFEYAGCNLPAGLDWGE